MSTLPKCPGSNYKLCKKNLHWYIPGKGCAECKSVARLNRYHRNKAAGKAWHQKNMQRHLENGRKNYWKNTTERKNKWKEWRKNNLEHDLERNRQYAQNNKDVVRRKAAKRRANKKTQTPTWADLNKINCIYRNCPEKHHVDHIYPLKSDYLCGLHVETNLQILTEIENISKGNRTWPGQLDCQKGSVYAIFPKELTDLLND
jgi:hypothetical protein